MIPSGMKPRMVVLQGGTLTDSCFSIIKAGVEIVWNVTKIQRAADAGALGSPVELPMSIMPPPRYDLGFLDAAKIAFLKTRPGLLDLPSLAIAAPESGHILCFCDGQHRLTARYELRLPSFSTFIVPTEVEGRFRITERRASL